jgi:hypothetical protein
MRALTGMEPMGFIILSIIPAILPNRNLKLRHQFSGHTTQSNLVIANVVRYKKYRRLSMCSISIPAIFRVT